MKGIKASLQAIQEKLQAIQENFAWMKGRIETLPTTMQMITLVFGILGGAFVILRFGLPHP